MFLEHCSKDFRWRISGLDLDKSISFGNLKLPTTSELAKEFASKIVEAAFSDLGLVSGSDLEILHWRTSSHDHTLGLRMQTWKSSCPRSSGFYPVELLGSRHSPAVRLTSFDLIADAIKIYQDRTGRDPVSSGEFDVVAWIQYLNFKLNFKLNHWTQIERQASL